MQFQSILLRQPVVVIGLLPKSIVLEKINVNWCIYPFNNKLASWPHTLKVIGSSTYVLFRKKYSVRQPKLPKPREKKKKKKDQNKYGI